MKKAMTIKSMKIIPMKMKSETKTETETETTGPLILYQAGASVT
jgi:hypothetical protein